MARPKPIAFDKVKTVADNRRVRFDYFVEDVFEAGLALAGTEVKALRAGEATIRESYAEIRDGQVWRAADTSRSAQPLSRISRALSRFQSRSLMVLRLSTFCLPLASASSTLARPVRLK